MRRNLILAVLSVLLLIPALAGAGTWTIDPEHSTLQFKVRHMMVTNVTGVFEKFRGTVEIDDQDLAKSKAEIVIDTASLNTRVEKRDEHLRSADFFDVGRYPTMTFVSRNVVADGPERLRITGDLTIRGISRPVLLQVEGPTGVSKDPWGNLRRGASVTTKLYRQDYGMTWNKTLETGGVAVGDEVQVALEIELLKAK